MANNRRKDALAWGIILIVIGFVFFLDSLDIKVWDAVARLWPLALIVWGAWKMYFGLKEKKKDAKPAPSERELP